MPHHAFAEVVRQEGFSQAAKTMFTTQSTVSKAVKQLEDELGLKLLDRIGHHSTLTAVGEIVYRRALAMLAERDDLVAELDELRGLKRGVLRIGLPPIGSDVLFAPMFAIYRSRYPGVDIQLVEHGSKRLEELVLAGGSTLGLRFCPCPKTSNGRRFAASRSMRFSRLTIHWRKVPASKRWRVPFILFEAGFALNPIILDACQKTDLRPPSRPWRAILGARSDVKSHLPR